MSATQGQALPVATCGLYILLVVSALAPVDGIVQELYTTNAICVQNHCVNPVFPGLEDLGRLETIQWQCSDLDLVKPYLDFCKSAVNYPPAIPSPNASSATLESLVFAQDDAAATMFYYHLAGMGIEAWDHQKPAEGSDDCVKAVYRQVCFTYFPKSEAGCQKGQSTQYLRPCKNTCEKYIAACGVECCDESIQCVFSHSLELSGGKVTASSGYVNEDGPFATCTGEVGGASRRHTTNMVLLLALLAFQVGASSFASLSKMVIRHQASLLAVVVLLGVSCSLQGCSVQHELAHWREKPDYIADFKFIPPGAGLSDAKINSCDIEGLDASMQCSGHGICKPLNPASKRENPLKFCECDRDWADPECRTQRKSQAVAWTLSILGGPLGLDEFYMGNMYLGIQKLATLGGLGVLWVIDIVRIGCAPIYAKEFRLAADLPHPVFVFISLALFSAIGVVLSLVAHRKLRIKNLTSALIKRQEAFVESRSAAPLAGPAGHMRHGLGAIAGHGVPRVPGIPGTSTTSWYGSVPGIGDQYLGAAYGPVGAMGQVVNSKPEIALRNRHEGHNYIANRQLQDAQRLQQQEQVMKLHSAGSPLNRAALATPTSLAPLSASIPAPLHVAPPASVSGLSSAASLTKMNAPPPTQPLAITKSVKFAPQLAEEVRPIVTSPQGSSVHLSLPSMSEPQTFTTPSTGVTHYDTSGRSAVGLAQQMPLQAAPEAPIRTPAQPHQMSQGATDSFVLAQLPVPPRAQLGSAHLARPNIPPQGVVPFHSSNARADTMSFATDEGPTVNAPKRFLTAFDDASSIPLPPPPPPPPRA